MVTNNSPSRFNEYPLESEYDEIDIIEEYKPPRYNDSPLEKYEKIEDIIGIYEKSIKDPKRPKSLKLR